MTNPPATGREPKLTEALEAFAKELIRDSWEGCDGGDIIQEVALKHGLIKCVPFDPAIHSDVVGFGYVEGDPWYVFAGVLSALQPSDSPALDAGMAEALLKDADWLDSYGRDCAEEGDADTEMTGMHLERIAERIRSALSPTRETGK